MEEKTKLCRSFNYGKEQYRRIWKPANVFNYLPANAKFILPIEVKDVVGMSKRIIFSAIALTLMLISLASAAEEKNIHVSVWGDVKLAQVYDSEYQEYYSAQNDFLIYSTTYQKTTEKTYNFIPTNGQPPANNYFFGANLYKNGAKIWTGEVPLFQFEEDILAGMKRIEFIIPYLDADTLEIVYNNNIKSKFAIDKKTCNSNKICDINEDYFSCPNDCKAGAIDGVCVLADDGICDADCGIFDSDCQASLLCTNNLIDSGEEFIDCGAVCNKACVYNDVSLDLIVRQYDKHKLGLFETSPYLSGKFKYEIFLNG